jgi:hypothetical protein
LAGWSALTVVLLIAVLTPGLLPPDQGLFPASGAAVVLLLCSVAALGYLLRAFRARIEVDEHQITLVTAGGERRSLRWDKIAGIREKPWHQRIELRDSSADMVLKLPFLLGLDRVRELIIARTNWPWLLDDEPLSRGASPPLPREFRLLGRRRMVPMVLLTLLLLAALYLAWISFHPALKRNLIFMPILRGLGYGVSLVSASFLLGTRCAVRVERGAIVVHWILRSERVTTDDVARVQMRSWMSVHSYTHSRVRLVLKGGREVLLPELRVSTLLLYRTILAGLGRLPS